MFGFQGSTNAPTVFTSASNQVTLSLGANPGGATLSGTLTVTAASGVATFPNAILDKAAAGYTLVAQSASEGT